LRVLRLFSNGAILWVAGGLLLMAMLMPWSVVEDWRWSAPLSGIAHFLLFGAWGGILLWRIQLRMAGGWAAYGVAAGIAAGTAAWVELVQPSVGRTASAQDLLNGMAGIAVAAGGAYVWGRGHGTALRGLHLLVTGILLWVVSMPLVSEWRAYRWQARNFPVLGDFEDAEERVFWKPLGTVHGRETAITSIAEHATRGERSLRVRSLPGTWSGVSYLPREDDWKGYRMFAFDVFNPGPSFPLLVRIDDDGDTSEYSQRFNKRLRVSQGWNRLRIPLAEVEAGPKGRRLKLACIRAFYLFVAPQQPSRLFYLDNVHLE
jgi:hypothetical protein